MSYSVSDIRDYFEHIIKKYRTPTGNPAMNICIAYIYIYIYIENRIAFKVKTGYYLELLIPETIKLLESTKKKITKDKNRENIAHLEIFFDVPLVQ